MARVTHRTESGPGFRVSLYERHAGGALYLEHVTLGSPRTTKVKSLGHRDLSEGRVELQQLYRALCAPRAAVGPPPGTVGAVIDAYLDSAAYRATTPRVVQDRKRMLETVRGFPTWRTMPAEYLSDEHLLQYMEARTTGTHGERVVSRRRAQAELQALRTACHWAYRTKIDGTRLLETRVFDGLTIPEARRAPQPTLQAEEFAKLWAARGKHAFPGIGLALALHYVYGKRSRAVRHLQWTALERPGRIFWDPAFDKEGQTGDFPVPEDLQQLIEAWRAHPARPESPWVFAAPRDPDHPIARVSYQQWNLQLYRHAGLVRPLRGGWHAFRRGFTSRQQGEQAKAAMVVAGMTTIETFTRYQQPSDAQILSVLANRPVVFDSLTPAE